MTTKTLKGSVDSDRRVGRRRQILDSFSFFLVIPKRGGHRLQLNDISDTGLAFSVDIEGEIPDEPPIEAGEVINAQLYLNQSIYLPVSLQVVRVENGEQVRKIGASFSDRNTKEYQTLQAFLQLLDHLLETVKFAAAG